MCGSTEFFSSNLEGGAGEGICTTEDYSGRCDEYEGDE